MDKKSLLTPLLLMAAIFLGYQFFFNKKSSAPQPPYRIYQHIEKPSEGYSEKLDNKPPVADMLNHGAVLGGGENDVFTMHLSNVTAGIDSVQINKKFYASDYKRKDALTLFTADPDLGKPFSTMGVHVKLGGVKVGSDLEFEEAMEVYAGAVELHPEQYKEDVDAFLGACSAAEKDAAKRAQIDGIQKELWSGKMTATGREALRLLINEKAQVDLEALRGRAAQVPALPVAVRDATRRLVANANSTGLLDCQYTWQVDPKQKATATDAYYYMKVVVTVAGTNQVQELVQITKHFHLDPNSFELTVTHTVENLWEYPVRVRIDQLTAPALARDDPQTDDRYFHGAMLQSSGKKTTTDKAYDLPWSNLRKAAESSTVPGELGTVLAGQMEDYGKDPILWMATSNRFFSIIVMPLPGAGAAPVALDGSKGTIGQQAHVAAANIDLMRTVQDKPEEDVAIVRLTGKFVQLEKKGSADKEIRKDIKEEALSVYMGPKHRSLLAGSGAKIAGVDFKGNEQFGVYGYSKLVQFNTCMLYSFCVFDQVAYAILWTLDFFKSYIGNYGIAIMILVILVRLLLHPLTRASQINMAKMGKQMRDVQPQLEAVKRKYADDKRRQGEETMRIYRENKINPAGGIMGCLPMLIQMPIWAALYSGLRSDIDLRHAVFIPGWINDLASPDKLLPPGVLSLGHPLFHLPLLGDIYGLNLLPILLAGVFYFQMKVTTATQPKPADEQQAQMQKMSQYMIFLFPLMLYNAPSGLNLYIFASTMGGLLDTYLVRKTLKKQGILASNAPLLPTSGKETKEEKPE